MNDKIDGIVSKGEFNISIAKLTIVLINILNTNNFEETAKEI